MANDSNDTQDKMVRTEELESFKGSAYGIDSIISLPPADLADEEQGDQAEEAN